jgi:hypothetical protein
MNSDEDYENYVTPLEETNSKMFKVGDKVKLLINNIEKRAKVYSIGNHGSETVIQIEFLWPFQMPFNDEFWNSYIGTQIKEGNGSVAIENSYQRLFEAVHLIYDKSSGNFIRIGSGGMESYLKLEGIIFKKDLSLMPPIFRNTVLSLGYGVNNKKSSKKRRFQKSKKQKKSKKLKKHIRIIKNKNKYSKKVK